MAQIYEFIPAGFSFRKERGYNMILPVTIGKYFEHARGIGTDLYVIKYYGQDGEQTELTRGCIPTGKAFDTVKLKKKQIDLTTFLDTESAKALQTVTKTSRVYQKRLGKNSIVYIKAKGGVIGCGWYDNANTPKKGLKLAAFVLYALGTINPGVDEILWEAAYHYLPYDSELGRNDIADEIILSSMQDEVVRRNNEPAKIVPIVPIDNNN